jgi:murein L,D-transpeptidase YafK
MKRWTLALMAVAASTIGVLVWAQRPDRLPLPPGAKATLVVVEKAQRLLTLYSGSNVLKRYHVSLGREPGAKRQEGDHRTPEGHYVIDFHRADSGYYRALHISYPSPADISASPNPGGAIMIHGLRNGWGWLGRLHRLVGTNGCVVVTNQEMQELWRAIDDGTPIVLRP